MYLVVNTDASVCGINVILGCMDNFWIGILDNMIIPEINCLRCHFLRSVIQTVGMDEAARHPDWMNELDDEMRNQIRQAIAENQHDIKALDIVIGADKSLACVKDLWTNGDVDRNVILDILDREIPINRSEACFFFRYTPRMSVATASILEERDANRREAKKDRDRVDQSLSRTKLALIISIIALFATLIWNAYVHFYPPQSATTVDIQKPVEIQLPAATDFEGGRETLYVNDPVRHDG